MIGAPQSSTDTSSILPRTNKHARLLPISRLAMHMVARVPRTICLLAALAIAGSSLSACAADATKRATDEPANFEGVWTTRQCDSRAPERECGIFTLYLTQDGERICGRHFAATPGLSKLEESDPGSVLGTHSGNKAFLFVANSRTGSKELVVVERISSDLKWHVVGPVVSGDQPWDNMILQNVALRRDTSEHVGTGMEQLRQDCRWPDARTEEQV